MDSIVTSLAAALKLSQRTLVSCYRLQGLIDGSHEPSLKIIEAVLPFPSDCEHLSDGFSESHYDEKLRELQFREDDKTYQGPILIACQKALDASIDVLKGLCGPLEAAVRPGARQDVRWPFDPPSATDDALEALEKQARVLRAAESRIRTKIWTDRKSNMESVKVKTKAADLLQWYKICDPERNHKMCQQSREPGSGAWVFENANFQQWKLAPGGEVLWLHGAPGVGKSVLFSTVADHVISQLSVSSEPDGELQDRAAYFYFSFSDSSKQGVTNLLKSIIHQLVASNVSSESEMAQDLYKTKLGVGVEASIEELLAVYLDEVSHTKRTFLMIDALDECLEGERKEFFARCLDKLLASNSNILVTSRRKHDIKDGFSKFRHRSISLDAEDVDADIRAYTDSYMRYDPILSSMSVEIQKEISDGIVSGARGMFRWAVCQLDIIRHCQTPEKLRHELQAMPGSLDGIYERILDRVPRGHQRVIQAALWWLSFSARPLLLEELSAAVAIELESDGSDSDSWVLCEEDSNDAESASQLDSQSIMDMCGVLVTAVTQHRLGNSQTRWLCEKDTLEHREMGISSSRKQTAVTIISLSHYSVKEYIVSDRLQKSAFSRYYASEELGNSFLACCCLQYLIDFNDGKVASVFDFDRNRLLEYTARNWMRHWSLAFRGDDSQHLRRLCERLFDPGDRSAYTNCLNLWDPDNEFREGFVGSFSRRTKSADLFPQPLYWASLLGDIEVVKSMIDKGADMFLYQGHFESALGAAVYRGHMDIVELFLASGMTPNVQGKRFGSVLQIAVASGRIPMVQRLLDAGADVNIQGGLKWDTAIDAAAANRFQDVVALLLKHGANPNIEAQQGGTALYRAAKAGDFRLVTTLLAAGADVNGSDDIYTPSPIYGATSSGSLAIVDLLISKGADVNKVCENQHNRYPLLEAIDQSHDEIALALLQAGADPNVRGNRGTTSLELSIRHRRGPVFDMLIDVVADVNACSDRHETCLSKALRHGYEVASILRDRGAEITSGDAVSAVIRYRNEPWVLDTILERGLDINRYGDAFGDSCLTTALHVAATSMGSPALVKRLLDHGAYVNAIDKRELTSPLGAAVKSGQSESARMLIARGADVHIFTTRSIFELAISFACTSNGTLEMAELLLEAGCDIREDAKAALGAAIDANSPEVLRWLVARGVDIDRPLCPIQPSKSGSRSSYMQCTALQYAAQLAETPMVLLLLDLGAQVDGVPGLKGSTLHYGLLSGNTEIVHLLLDKGARADDYVPDCSTIHKAISKDMDGLIPTLIERGADVNALESGSSPLMAAYQAGKRELFASLWQRGARFSERDARQANPVIKKHSLDDLKFLLEHGLDPKGSSQTTSLVDAAAKKANCSAIETLVEAGAQLSAEKHQRAFDDACEAGQVIMAEYLLSKIPDLDVSKALKSAARSPNNLGIVEMLFKNGADVASGHGACFQSAARADCQRTIARLLEQPMSPSERANYLGQALQVAAYEANITLTEWLLDTQGADVNHTGMPHGSPLQACLSITRSEIGNQTLVFRNLIRHGANVNPPITAKPIPKLPSSLLARRSTTHRLFDKSGTFASPLSLALQGRSHERSLEPFAIELLALGADVNGIGGEYHTPLQAAAWARPNMVRRLLDAGADPNIAGGRLGTALHAAAWNKSVSNARLLLERGADATISAGDYGSILQAAAVGGTAKAHTHRLTIEMMDLLYEAGADVHARDGEFGSAVQMAAASDNVAALEWLDAHGADIRVKGGRYENAYKAATSAKPENRPKPAVQWQAISWLEQHYGKDGWE